MTCSLDNFLQRRLNMRQPTGCAVCLPHGLWNPLEPRGWKWAGQCLSNNRAVGHPFLHPPPSACLSASHPLKTSHKQLGAKSRSRSKIFHKLRWQFMPRSKRTDKPHNTSTSRVNCRYYSYSCAKFTLILELFASMSRSNKFHWLIRCHFKVYSLSRALNTIYILLCPAC